MTRPALPHTSLTDTPVFASLLNDPVYGELARELLDPTPVTPHRTYPSSSFLAEFGHPSNCPSCSTASLAWSMHNPRPAVNRGLALPPGSTTDASRLQPARVARPRGRKQAK